MVQDPVDIQVLKDHKVVRVVQVTKEEQDQVDLQVTKDFKETQVLQVEQVVKVLQVVRD